MGSTLGGGVEQWVLGGEESGCGDLVALFKDRSVGHVLTEKSLYSNSLKISSPFLLLQGVNIY